MGSTVQQTMAPDNWDFVGRCPCLCHGGSYYQYRDHGPFYIYYYIASIAYDVIGCRLQERPPKAA